MSELLSLAVFLQQVSTKLDPNKALFVAFLIYQDLVSNQAKISAKLCLIEIKIQTNKNLSIIEVYKYVFN